MTAVVLELQLGILMPLLQLFINASRGTGLWLDYLLLI